LNDADGFLLSGSSRNDLTANVATGNALAGFRLFGADYNNLIGNRATGTGNGYHLDSADTNTLSGNVANHNSGIGFEIVNGSDYNALFNNIAESNEAGFYVESSDHNTLTGNTATGNRIDGFSLACSDNNVLTSNTAMQNEHQGFRLEVSGNNILTSNIATGNQDDGFFLRYSDHNILQDNTASLNADSGFVVGESAGNTLTANTASGNGMNGVLLDGASSNYVSGNTITGNIHGISLEDSSENVIWGNTIQGNSNGIAISDSDHNTLHTNMITGNTGSGISLSASSDNLIYNNYFNNWNNVVFEESGRYGAVDPPVYANRWNIPKTYGLNIIGGEYEGGNYWARPDGTGYSQVMPVNGYGFAYPLILGEGNVDYLPLSIQPQPNNGATSTGAATRPLWDSKFTSYSIPSSACACHGFPISVTVNNTGSIGWLGPIVALAAVNDAAEQFSPVRIPIEENRTVGPGSSCTLTFELQAPCTPGTYELEYSMVKGEDTPFGDVLIVTVVVDPCGNIAREIPTMPDRTKITQEIPGLDQIPAPGISSEITLNDFRENSQLGRSWSSPSAKSSLTRVTVTREGGPENLLTALPT
jgi:parallel beta-helix repeat protein